MGGRKKIGEALLEEKLVSTHDVKSALAEQQFLRSAKDRKPNADFSTVRVKAGKLDDLMALVGELVSAQARVRESAHRHPEDDDLSAASEHLGRLMDELRENSMSVRMIPVGSVFSGFKRLVRDLSFELKKEARLEIQGEDTELDKTIVEQLHDPLLHLIRNCIDHGLESPADRLERGKIAQGTVKISAVHSGSFVTISVEDDGRGLDLGAIRQKAIQKGLLSQDCHPSERELFGYIFMPGFSTNSTVTSVSGRGVGLDVVKSQMDLIGGTVETVSVENSFTRFSLKIPLTLAIIDGLLVRVDEEHYVIPLSCVSGCLDFLGTVGGDGSSIVEYQGRQLPCVDLRSFFGVPGSRPIHSQSVIVNVRESRYGLVVDSIIGNIQVVVKPLGPLYKDARGISSATIRGDGSVALILDPEKIIL